MKKVAVVIPFYKPSLSQDEEVSLLHLSHFLGPYDKFLALPKEIRKTTFYIPKSKIIHFPSEYFTNVSKYCEMLNSKFFYQAFKNYEYILIYQLDALVFKDALLYWCNKGYDFIGSPLFNDRVGRLSKPKRLNSEGCNGGLSLRRVNKFIKIIESLEKTTRRSSEDPRIRKRWFLNAVLTGKSHKKWLDAPARDYPFNEDGFWSFEARKYDPSFKVASLKDALRFGFERFPRRCFKLNDNKLPFGCHAWAKYDREFWEPYLLK